MVDKHIQIKKHTKIKYRIIKKYIDACSLFDSKYHNVAFIDTHGGSGNVWDTTTKSFIPGSPMLATKIGMSHIIEVNDQRAALLRAYLLNFPNVIVHQGDCNEIISDVLSKIPGNKFIPCLIDPNAFTYRKDGSVKMQLTAQTIDAIAKHTRTEILLNLVVSGFARTFSLTQKGRFPDHISPLLGSDEWKELQPHDYINWKNMFINNRLKGYYKYIDAFLITTNNSPLYYLIYATNNVVGYKIMKSIFDKEPQADETKDAFTLTNWLK